ncbi:sulfatase family protein [Coraliomargarita sp. W4R72]
MKNLISALSLFAYASISLVAQNTTAKQPNILFIFSDDHALEAISAYNGRFKDIAKTPNIDRLAAQGAIFENSFVTNSICGPSRASILTGKHSHINGYMKNGQQFDGSQWSFQKDLRKAGYSTALIGKWHLGGHPQGFEHWEIYPGQGSYYNPDFITMDGKTHREVGYSTDIVTEKAITWLDNRDKSKPFLLMCQHKAPHRTFAPALRHLSAFNDIELPEPVNLFDDYSTRSKPLAKNQMSIANHFGWTHDLKIRPEESDDIELEGEARGPVEYRRMNPAQKEAWDAHYGPLNKKFVSDYKAGNFKDKDTLTRWKYQRYLKNYLATVKSVDESVGELLDYLDANGLTENTIVVYSSDQGFYLGEHGWYDKRWMYEESFKMPFIIRWPGTVAPNTRPTALIQNIDYAPTFLEAAGLAIPEAVQGRSLLPVLQAGEQTPQNWRRSLYYHYWMHGGHGVPEQYGVRTLHYKLIHFPRSNEWEMFDLMEDPNEMNNIYEMDPERSNAMRVELEFLRKKYGDVNKS